MRRSVKYDCIVSKTDDIPSAHEYVPTTSSSGMMVGPTTQKKKLKILLTDLKAGRRIQYFASDTWTMDVTTDIPKSVEAAYRDNQGVADVNEKGEAVIHVAPPSIYFNDRTESYHPRHIHFFYENRKTVYTRRILVPVSANSVEECRGTSRCILLEISDTRSPGTTLYFPKLDDRVTPYTIRDLIEERTGAYINTPHAVIPLVIVASSVDKAEKIGRRLNEMGFFNLFRLSKK